VSEILSTIRSSERRPEFGLGIVITTETKVNCVIRDLSRTGAKLGISRRVKLPSEFTVALLRTKTMRRVVLRWRRGDFVGVEFCPKRER
jgi:PilZ domain